MKTRFLTVVTILIALIMVSGCSSPQKKEKKDGERENMATMPMEQMQEKVDEFVKVKLDADLSYLSEDQREMISHLIDAAQLMDQIFWEQAFGQKTDLLNQLYHDPVVEFAQINYGPWDRLNENKPFIKGYGEKPAGANFYPADMTKEEFRQFEAEDKKSLYTLIRRDKSGNLKTVPYNEAYEVKTSHAAALLREAAKLAENESFRTYLNERAKALLSDEYLASDLAWMEVKDNDVDFVVGPIENYEDNLFGYKAAHEAFVLLKDRDWSEKLDKFNELMPQLQKSLPVADRYKQQMPGIDSDLGVYQAIYYAGDCNAGSKTIAINLPNDERVQTQKGTRKLQLKNAMRYKFEKILKPISDVLITPEQREYIQFNAFFENTMFHEVAHGLGIKQTINGKGSVREALKAYYSPVEEGKADIIGLYLVKQLAQMDELEDQELKDNYVTFMASIFRSIRFGAASSHGKANMIRFNYFKDKGAFTRDAESGTYKVNFDKMTQAMNELGEKILVIQGDGDYEAAREMVEKRGVIKDTLQQDLERLSEEGIPRDIRFDQGKHMLGLSR